MASEFDGGEPLPLRIHEIRAMIIGYIDNPPDLLNCACINSSWNLLALARLYKGSLNDMKFRTPDIGSLNCLFVASRERFARNMAFVDHLVLEPENPVAHQPDFASSPYSFGCVERCRALQNRLSSQLLLQPNKGPRSIALPFELLHQNIEDIFDLFLHPRLEFLTIDSVYLDILLSTLNSLRNDRSGDLYLPLALSNLQALSIYISNPDCGSADLCRILDFLDLKLFQIQHEGDEIHILEDEVLDIVKSLRRKQKLEVLSLKGVSKGSITLYDLLESVKEANMQVLWPNLQALYLVDFEFSLLENLAKYTKLESIYLRVNSISRLGFAADSLPAKNLAKCRHLRIVDIKIDNLWIEEVQWLLEIAHGCPMLQKLRFKSNPPPGVQLLEEQLSEILRALPRIELLTLDIKVCVSGSTLLDLPCYTPRLSTLRMMRSQLSLSYESLKQASSICSLEHMEFEDLIFDDSLRLSRPHQFSCLAREWKRVFPFVRTLPCFHDAYHTYESWDICDDTRKAEDGKFAVRDSANSDESSEEDIVDHDVELRSLESDSDSKYLRRRLWRALNFHLIPYPPVPSDYMWQTDFEIKNFGWPILPLSAFYNPQEYSSSNTKYEK